VAMRSNAGPWHEPDGPDSFFNFSRRENSGKVQPGWKKRISPTPANFRQDVVFFTPITDKKDLEWDGYCHPKMYSKKRVPHWLAQKYKKAELKVWRGMSKRVKGEFRFKRLPRDDNGKVVGGSLFTNRRPKEVWLRPGQSFNKKRPRIGPSR